MNEVGKKRQKGDSREVRLLSSTHVLLLSNASVGKKKRGLSYFIIERFSNLIGTVPFCRCSDVHRVMELWNY